MDLPSTGRAPGSDLSPAATGALTARALAGSWRTSPPAPTLSADELAAVAPHLLATGAGGLGWWGIREHAALARTAAGQDLRDGYRIHTLQAGLYEARLERVLQLCDELGIEPLLLKGWTVARLYPARGMRPYGDVDLAVAAADHARLEGALAARPGGDEWVGVDLEHRFLTADATPLATLMGRAEHVELGGRRVCVPRAEDQLRLVSVHFLRAGGWHARGLCDAALMLESASGQVDWDIVIGDRLHRQWVTIVAGLASQLLGADLGGLPVPDAREQVPGWVQAHVLAGFGSHPRDHVRSLPRFRPSLDPRELSRQVRERWPSDGLALTLHHRRRIPRRSPRAVQGFDMAYRAAGLILPVKLRRARRDGSPELAR